VLNGLAALVALAAAVAAGRRRSSPRGAELIRLQPPPFEPHLLRHAA
jgi:hypothetical protein